MRSMSNRRSACFNTLVSLLHELLQLLQLVDIKSLKVKESAKNRRHHSALSEAQNSKALVLRAEPGSKGSCVQNFFWNSLKRAERRRKETKGPGATRHLPAWSAADTRTSPIELEPLREV